MTFKKNKAIQYFFWLEYYGIKMTKDTRDRESLGISGPGKVV